MLFGSLTKKADDYYLYAMRNLIAHMVFSLWPHFMGLDRLMGLLRPTVPQISLAKRKIRGFPLSMFFAPQTYMGKFLYYRGIYEEGVIKKLRTLLTTGMNFIDVGANAGMYSLIASHLVGPEGKVVAFEPQAKLRDVIKRNIELNHIENIKVRPEALGSEAGEGKIYQVNRDNDGQATMKVLETERVFSEPEDITIIRLSDILSDLAIPKIHGMKIDVEGAEHEALLGLKPLLESSPPLFILFECIEAHLNRFGTDTGTLFDYLIQYEYELYCLRRGRWRRVKSVEDHKKYAYSTDFIAIHSKSDIAI